MNIKIETTIVVPIRTISASTLQKICALDAVTPVGRDSASRLRLIVTGDVAAVVAEVEAIIDAEPSRFVPPPVVVRPDQYVTPKGLIGTLVKKWNVATAAGHAGTKLTLRLDNGKIVSEFARKCERL